MRRLAAACSVFASLATAAADFEYLPPSPQAGEPFAIVGTTQAANRCPLLTMTATVVGDQINVREYSGSGYAGLPWACRLGSLVPGLPAGRYIADLRLSTGALGSPGVVTVTPGEAASPARRDLTGNWFNRDESGWGLNIVQGDSGKLFIAWVMYSPTDTSSASYSVATFGHWLIVPDGRWLTPTTWRGVAFQTLNVAMFEPDNPKLLQATPAGYVEISFTGAGEATMRGRFIVGTTVEPMIEKHATLRRFEF